MKLKAFLLALAVAGLAASFGLTAAGHSDTGTTTAATTTTTPTTTATARDCRRFELRGTLVTVSASSFTAKVTQAEHASGGTVGATVTVAVGPDTRVSWSGKGTLTGPNAGDTVRAQGTQCGGSTGPLTASRVSAEAAKAAKQDGSGRGDDHGKDAQEHGSSHK